MPMRKRKYVAPNTYVFDPKTMKAEFKPPRAIKQPHTVYVPDSEFDAYLAAARERWLEDERKWQRLMDLYSNKCRNGGSYQ